MLNVSTRTVHRMSRSGELDYVLVGRHSRYPVDQFARFVGQNTVDELRRRVQLLQNPVPANVAAEDEAEDFLG